MSVCQVDQCEAYATLIAQLPGNSKLLVKTRLGRLDIAAISMLHAQTREDLRFQLPHSGFRGDVPRLRVDREGFVTLSKLAMCSPGSDQIDQLPHDVSLLASRLQPTFKPLDAGLRRFSQLKDLRCIPWVITTDPCNVRA